MQKPSKRVVEAFEMLKDGKSVNFESMVKRLGCKAGTAMVLICALRRSFGAEIETERDGRKVISYRLTNASKIAANMVLTKKVKAPKVAKVAVAKTKSTVSRKKVDGETPTIDSEFDVTEVTDAELADLKQQLGIG